MQCPVGAPVPEVQAGPPGNTKAVVLMIVPEVGQSPVGAVEERQIAPLLVVEAARKVLTLVSVFSRSR